MTWADIPKNPTSKVLRQFAAVWLVFFLGLGMIQYFKHGRHETGIVLGVAALLIGPIGIIRPAVVRWIFVSWMILAFPIGWSISQVALFLMFYGVLMPVALLLRLQGRDSLLLRRPTEPKSYWVPTDAPKDAASYLRQY